MVAVVAGVVGPATVAAVRPPPVVAASASSTTAATGSTASTASTEASTASNASPLEVTLQTLQPATIPRRGRLTITGRITNRSQDTWTALNAYLTTSHDPITSRSALADADATPADTPVAERLASAGLYDQVGDLAPGASVGYRLSVRRSDLGISGQPGVYWVGVHVLGANDDGRDTVADGRARTFMPLMPAADTSAGEQAQTRLSLVVPVEKPVRRGRTAQLLDLKSWEKTVAEDGRLRRVLGLSAGAGPGLTWLVDPAVLDAVGSVAAGDPALDTAPTTDDDTGSASPSPSPSSRPSASTDASAGTGDDSSGDSDSAAATDARGWLADFRRQSVGHRVLALPYGDLDVAAVLRGPVSALYARATSLSTAALADHGVQGATPVVSPDSGYLPSDVVKRLDPGSTALLRDAAAPDADSPVLGGADQAPVVLADTRAGSGGPAPGPTYSALAVRQRLLSDAALHALGSDRDEPLVVRLPDDWDPGSGWEQADFFGGLTQPWLQLVDLPSVGGGAARSGATPTLTYPRKETSAEVPIANQLAARELVRAGGVFARLLTNNDTVDDQLSRVAVLGTSIAARKDPEAARRRTTSTTAYVRSEAGQVHVVGPPFVMMSGESGPIQVTLVNDLQETVTAGIEVTTPGSALRISRFEPVTLGPGRRTSIRLEASSDDIGVHPVTIRVTDASGVPLGSETRFNVRTSHVSTVIWVIMGVGAVLLFLTIAVRLVRRVRRRRATPGPLLPREGGPSGGSSTRPLTPEPAA